MFTGILVTAASAALSAAVVALVLWRAPRLGLVQHPNSRSSHLRPTPSGGGIGIVLGGSLGGVAVIQGGGWPAAVLLLAALGIAGLGLWDDLRPLPAMPRLVVQVLLVTLAVAVAIPLDALQAALGWTVAVPFLLAVLVLGLVYWVNLFNFMDGIDGIAGTEAVFLLLAPLGLAVAGGTEPGGPLLWWPLGMAAAVAGFLIYNWQPARIFMGDVGSTFLGFVIAIFALLEIAVGWISCWEALILGACFATDGTVTLVRRALRREPLLTAHRRHAYQRLARRFGSHRRVVLAIAAINLLWLLPVALAARLLPTAAPFLTLIAYLPLTALALVAGAGRPEHA